MCRSIMGQLGQKMGLNMRFAQRRRCTTFLDDSSGLGRYSVIPEAVEITFTVPDKNEVALNPLVATQDVIWISGIPRQS